jgi:hypothetical protein
MISINQSIDFHKMMMMVVVVVVLVCSDRGEKETGRRQLCGLLQQIDILSHIRFELKSPRINAKNRTKKRNVVRRFHFLFLCFNRGNPFRLTRWSTSRRCRHRHPTIYKVCSKYSSSQQSQEQQSLPVSSQSSGTILKYYFTYSSFESIIHEFDP